MDKATQRIAIGGLVVVVILALLIKRKGTTVYQEGDLGDITLKEGDRYEYIVPPLESTDFDWGVFIPPRVDLGDLETSTWKGLWDWMQTTNLGCACDVGFRKQVFIQPPPPQPQRPTILFQYVNPSSAMNYTTPNMPPLLTAATIPGFDWNSYYWVKLDGIGGMKQVGRDVDYIDNYTVRYNGVNFRSDKKRPANATFMG